MAHVIEGQRSFTVAEYHRMGAAGVFGAGERVELIRGVIREMSPKGRRHVQAVAMANNLLTPALSGKAVVLVQDPVALPDSTSEPEPDLCVLSTNDPRKAGAENVTPLLVIEVSESSLRFDRDEKSTLYAEAAGIPEYWIVNLVDGVLEIYREPRDGRYRQHAVLKTSDSVAPEAFPELELSVRGLIP